MCASAWVHMVFAWCARAGARARVRECLFCVYLRRILATLGRARRDFGEGAKGWYGKGGECGGGRKCSLKRQEYGGSEATSTLHVLEHPQIYMSSHTHTACTCANVRVVCARTRTRAHTHRTHRIGGFCQLHMLACVCMGCMCMRMCNFFLCKRKKNGSGMFEF
jgi:hypothetical protein